MSEGTLPPATGSTPAPAPAPAPAAPTQPAAVSVDLAAILSQAEAKANEAAERKTEAVFKSMLKQQGLDDEAIGKMLTEYKAKQTTPETELKQRDETIGTLQQQLESERQDKVALSKGVPLGSEDEAIKSKVAACMTLAKSYVSTDVTFEAALDKALGIISFTAQVPEANQEPKPPMWGGAGNARIQNNDLNKFSFNFTPLKPVPKKE